MVELNFSLKEFEILVSNKRYQINFETQLNMEKVRNEFNKIISSMAIKNNENLFFYILKISERNTLSSSIFLNFCRIKLIENLNKKNKKIIINTNQYSIYAHFKEWPTTSIISKILFLSLLVFEYIISILRPFKRVIEVIQNKLLCISHEKFFPISNSVIIQTFVSDISFKNDKFHDLYYEDVRRNFIGKKKKLKIWPIFYNLNKKREALNYFKGNKENFLILENYLKWNDVFQFLKNSFSFKFFKPYQQVFKKDYKYYYFIKYWIEIDSLSKEYLYYTFIKNLKKNSCNNISFLFNQENLIPQKIPLFAIRKYFPHSETFGYFHTSKPRNLLNLEYCSEEEFHLAPKPKTILFNSKIYKNYYFKKWNKFHVKDVMSIKFKDIDINKIKKTKYSDKKILILLPETAQETKYFLKIINTISDEYQFLIKTHPMRSLNYINSLPSKNISIINDWTKQKIVNNCSKLLCGYTGFALELALSGIHVGFIFNPEKIFLNPFDDTNINNVSYINNKDKLFQFLNTKFSKPKFQNFFNTKNEHMENFISILEN